LTALPPSSPAVVAGGWAARIAIAVVFVLPLAVALPLALGQAAEPAAWAALWADPQLPRAAALTLVSALASTALALGATLVLTSHLHGSRAWRALRRALAPMLAVPHAAFAIGLAWLVAPAGALARLLAPWLGFDAPPAWITVNDPHAAVLTVGLVLKEIPFLLWSIAALLARPDVAAGLQAQAALGRSLGYGERALWWRVWWPRWLPRLGWPLLAVLAYALTVVDLALIVGPQSPPTLAQLAYADLVDADPSRNARGAAAALLLALLLALVVLTAVGCWPLLRRAWVRAATSGRRDGRWSARRAPVGAHPAVDAGVGPGPGAGGMRPAAAAVVLLAAAYAAVGVALALLSVAGVWPFPDLWPRQWSADAWWRVADRFGTLGLTTGLALAASAIALVLAVAWFEAVPARWDGRAMPLVLAPLVLPPLLACAGLYQAALHLRLDGSIAGLLWAHVLFVVPYAFIVLQPAWRGFDPRLEHTALALGRRRIAFWWRVKWPLLARPLAAAFAVGFAVSVVQFLPTQFIGAGRFATVTTEAVLLASGGQRADAAAFAALQACLPLVAFLAAAAGGRTRAGAG
jgi:putative thiamine transport system permease protein